MRRELLICLFLTVATLAVFWQVHDHEFINLDDCDYVTENLHVQKGFSRESVVWAFTTTHAANWHPLTWLSHMLDCQLYDLDPRGHHLTNVFFHLLNTLLLFFLLKRMTGCIWRSGFVAALFALHPLHVESVAWVAERKDVLSTFFWMLTIWAYAWYVERPQHIRYLLVLLAFAFGLMAKPMLVTLPFVLLLLDYWPLRRINAGQLTGSGSAIWIFSSKLNSQALRLIWEKVPLFVLAAASSTLTVFVQKSGGALGNFEVYPINIRFANALISYVRYIWKMIWPHHLVIFYLHPGESLLMWQTAGAAILLAIISVLLIWTGRRYRYLAVGWLWFLGTLVPVIGLVQVGAQAMADRYTYVPLIGLFIIITWGVPDLLARWHYRRIAIAFTTILLLPLLMVSTWTQLSHWHDSKTLWQYTLGVSANKYYAYNNLAEIANKEGNPEQAIAYYSMAFEANSAHESAISNIGAIFYKQGKYDEAINRFYQALRINPENAIVHSNLGEVFSRQGKFGKAIFHYTQAVTIDPKDFKAHNRLGKILARQGRLNEAIGHFSQAIKINPDYASARNNLGGLLVRQGKLDEAMGHLSQALRIDPDYAAAHNNMGNALERQGKRDEAVSHYSKAVEINPDYTAAHNNLGVLLASQGKLDEATAHFSEIVRIQPKDAQARNTLGYLLAQQGKLDEAISHFKEALLLQPDFSQARNNLEIAIKETRKNGKSIDSNSKL